MNKKYLYTFFYKFVLLLILVSCNKSEFNKTINLAGKEIINGDSLGIPSDILYMNEKIIILDDKPLDGNSYIKIYNTKGEKIQNIGRTGRGPGEYLGTVSLTKVVGEDNEFSVYDFKNLILNVYVSKNSNKFIPYKHFPINRYAPYHVVSIKNKRIAYLGLDLEHSRIAISDTSGKIIKQIGDIPPGKNSGTPVPIHLQAWLGDIKFSPDEKKIVLSTFVSDHIYVIDRDGNTLTKIVGPKNIVPVYKVANVEKYPVMEFDVKKCLRGYTDIVVGNKYIYALFLGTDFLTPGDPSVIHVFDYNGNYIEKILLDTPIFYFDIDFKNNILYGLQLRPENRIFEFKMDEK